MEDSLIEKKQAQRKKLLRALYGIVDGREGSAITPMQYFALGSQVGINQDVAGQIVRFLVSEGLLAMKPASGAVSLTHKGVVEVEVAVQDQKPVAEKSRQEGAALKLVTQEGECFEVVFQGEEKVHNRDGVFYLCRLNDLKDKQRGQRLVSIFRFGPEHFYWPDYHSRLESVLLNTIRRAFDSGRLTFDGPYDPGTYTEILLQPQDFGAQKVASGDEIQEFIQHKAYWLGFRYNANPGHPVSFGSPTDLTYLGLNPVDVRRYVLLMEQRGLLEKIMEGCGSPTHKLIEAVESPKAAKADDASFARMAIEEAGLSVPEPDGRTHPKVGVVIVKDGQVLAKAHRGEFPECHAEFIALEKKLANVSIVGVTVYATLEPCTTRNHPKVPCASRLAERGVKRVLIGMLDPNPDITGRGQMALSDANIETQFFPHELASQVKELNRDFIREQKQKSAPRVPEVAQKVERILASKERDMTRDVSEIVLEAIYLNHDPDRRTFPCQSISELPGKYIDDTSADGKVMRSEIASPVVVVAGIDVKAVEALGWKPTRLLFKDARTGKSKEFSGQLLGTLEPDILKFAIDS